MAQVIDGKQVAACVTAGVSEATVALKLQTHVTPGLAVVIVGNDPASHAYVKAKSKMAKQCGFNSFQHSLPRETTQDQLEELVARLNADSTVHGILVQLPLPKHLDAEPVISAISPAKDVDGLHIVNAGKIATGDLSTGLVSCTPAGAMLLVKRIHGKDLSGLNATVIGRSNLFGKPMALLLLAANATVTVAHSKTKNLASVCRDADILVVAVGRPQMVKADWVKRGATVIDVGINRVLVSDSDSGKSRLVGDICYDEIAQVAGAITPVPGGVGPMTIAMLMANTVIAAYRSVGEVEPKF
ncbi:bifunctional methylenetetrahydrofolate dehydrogenase/methenyltetrahydrofolate cyclohydrolase FolD [Ensifer adhaerens]|uniref:bifunctional methylenetetrahydrofolate dehydrogenase/methenyltetrahydrofolate cyclohydrolase FolD n=1 Tax=Ensifer adhaerens TaxID=106592 RepID=UPI001CBC98CA|nr:bifunctional methylenetetrahydrofolate dehydrogenase/methenyltetrahydrofolate cyclohydrolase FolD [Ensifer adhaerens]MBZ7924288.1 bifunctional methylenetetrahydrofolate dehydrogenase/methenyltetrahydrofolate cyclohydrolase FolD [Ensifer adhaerens]UAX96461.1 bifunctional methylenetetrahydrofolate dehydrogenase/methenyltetrahydrofolate cyclohydrolase FolD [Ensifer adhaerens]UAY04196.1 bifunctional methylenetetrahydrofolate dehydrogenase/methenyltetrahydrofolate cyclohydrolase FolD [Ensifer adha